MLSTHHDTNQSLLTLPFAGRAHALPPQVLVWNLSSSKPYVRLFDYESGREVQSLKLPKPSDGAPHAERAVGGKELAVTPDWKRVVMLREPGSVEVWSLEDGQRRSASGDDSILLAKATATSPSSRGSSASASPSSAEARAASFGCLAAFHDNARVAVAHADRPALSIWSMAASRVEKVLEGPKEGAGAAALAIGHIEVGGRIADVGGGRGGGREKWAQSGAHSCLVCILGSSPIVCAMLYCVTVAGCLTCVQGPAPR
jgi:hypothetical protein